jgi:hypothetical protein
MSDEVRRARMIKEMEKDFLPDYSASNLPSPEGRAAYALEHIAFRMSRIDRKLEEFIGLLTASLPQK